MLFVSTSGALGRHIDLPVPLIIASRSILAVLVLLLYCKWKGFSFKIAKKDRLPILASGIFLGLHWLTYFYSLKLSNVAIGMLSLFTYPIITSFLEPLLLKIKFQKIHFLLGALVLTGIYFLVPSFDLNNSYTVAIGVGLLSALFYALRNIILKKRIANYNGSSLMCFQLIVIAVLMSPVFLFYETDGFVEPVFGIIIAVFLLKEIPTLMTVVGGLLILSSVVIESVRSYKVKGS